MSDVSESFLRLVRQAAVRYLDEASNQIGAERWAQLDQVRIKGYSLTNLRSMLSQDTDLATAIVAECIGSVLAVTMVENVLAIEETS